MLTLTCSDIFPLPFHLCNGTPHGHTYATRFRIFSIRNQPDGDPAAPSEFRQITIKDVARLAGVSLMTVSRALNRPELVSAKTRELVRQAVERTGYIPNRLAGGLSGLHTGQVAVLVPSLSNLVFSDLLNGLASVLEPHGMQMMVGNYHYALVLVGPAPRSAAPLLRARALPMVETVELIDTPFDCNVGISHQDAGAAMAAYLTQQGYRSAAAVSANAGLERRTSQRIEGFCRYLAANNFPQPVRLDLENRSSISEGGKAMRRILDLPERPEVVFCANDDLAFGAMMACLDAGLRVPEDIGGLDSTRSILPCSAVRASPRSTSIAIGWATGGTPAAGPTVRRERR